MTDIDDQIREALVAEDQRILDELGADAGLFDLIAMGFRGKQAWIMYYMYILGFAAFFVGLYFLRRFFATPDLKAALGWALAIIACLFVLAIIKVVGWQQMLRQEMLREIKRLEMRVMLLADGKGAGH